MKKYSLWRIFKVFLLVYSFFRYFNFVERMVVFEFIKEDICIEESIFVEF